MTHGDRCTDLYSLKKKGWFKERENKKTEDVEIEKSQSELKFKPETINYEKVVKKLEKQKGQPPQIDYIPGMDKVRDRMERAR